MPVSDLPHLYTQLCPSLLLRSKGGQNPSFFPAARKAKPGWPGTGAAPFILSRGLGGLSLTRSSTISTRHISGGLQTQNRILHAYCLPLFRQSGNDGAGWLLHDREGSQKRVVRGKQTIHRLMAPVSSRSRCGVRKPTCERASGSMCGSGSCSFPERQSVFDVRWASAETAARLMPLNSAQLLRFPCS